MPKVVSDEAFLKAWQATGGSPRKTAQMLDISERATYSRRERLERAGVTLATGSLPANDKRLVYTSPEDGRTYCKRRPVELEDGVILVFSDAHWWPGRARTVAHEALLRLARDLKPAAIIANGDVLDAPQISRHDPLGWEDKPPLFAELENLQAQLAELREAARGAATLRTIGNHDVRFDRMLATRVPDVRHLAGMMLRDHLPDWFESWSVEVNGSVIVKHRWHNGIHGPYNNVLKGGRTIVTGHLHRLLATPFTDYNGRRYGVDTGTLADIGGQQFDYGEDSPANWGSGFAVLTFWRGQMLPPEFCEVINGQAFFRGSLIHAAAPVAAGGRSEVRGGGGASGRRDGDAAGLGDAARRASPDASRGVAGGPARPARNRASGNLSGGKRR
jgi:hypothetical protein